MPIQQSSLHIETLEGPAPRGAGPGSLPVTCSRICLPDLEKLTALIAPEAEALGFALVRVAWFEHGGQGSDEPTLQVMAERPDTRQLNIDDCAALSHRISDRFDELDPIEEAYRLEVSSPGIDRPLTRLADFADWAGHEAKIEVGEPIGGQKRFRGNLAGADLKAQTVDIVDDGGKHHVIAFDAIVAAKLLLTDRLIGSTAPLESAGADEIEAEPHIEDQQEEDHG